MGGMGRNIRVGARKQSAKKPDVYKCYRSITKPLKSQLEEKREIPLKKIKEKISKKSRSLGLIPIIQVNKHYYIAKGNNHSLVSSIIENNDYFFSPKPQNASFIWLQDNKKFDYSTKKNNVLVNMLEFHTELTNKDRLFVNLKALCRERGIDINEIVPVTFVLDFESQYSKVMLFEFLKYFVINHPKINYASKLKGSFTVAQVNQTIKIKYKQITSYISESKQLKSINSKQLDSIKPDLSHPISPKAKTLQKFQYQLQPHSTDYTWILKPANLNRGRNVHLFSKLKRLQQLLTLNDPLIHFKMYADPLKQTQHKYIIQRYLSNPLLINSRKFDIRVWVLIDTNMNCYYFKQGYLRMSGYQYNMTKQQIENTYIHLTNNAIQKNSEQYGKYEQGNQLSFEWFRKYLSEKTVISYQNIIERIKSLIKLSLEATLNLINGKGRKGCFQLLGYDFLIDQQGKTWLIECNNNPCLQESSDLLSRLLMILLKQTLHIVHKKKYNQNFFEKIL